MATKQATTQAASKAATKATTEATKTAATQSESNISATSHAKLSASSAERWFNCPGSPREVAKHGESRSEPAAQGTFAHHISHVVLTEKGKVAGDWLGNKTVIDGFTVECDEEMVDGVNYYVNDCRADIQPGDRVEYEVPLTDALRKLDPDFGGTADRVRWRPSTAHLLVTDLKYGAGVVVEPQDNKQLKKYALGALLSFGVSAKTITVRVVQPRIEHEEGRTRDFTFAGMEIMDFAADLIDAAKATRQPDAPLVPGWWCKKTFCPAAKSCPALEKYQHAMVAADFNDLVPYDLEKLEAGLDMIAPLKAKIAALESFAYAEATKGVQFKRWKLVEKKATRKWVDEDGATKFAKKHGVQPFEEPKLKSPAQMEKEMTKAAKGELAAFYDKKSSGTTLVPVSDDRPAVARITAADFDVVDTSKPKLLTVENLF